MTATEPRAAPTRPALDGAAPSRAGHFTAVAHGTRPQCRIRLLGDLDLATAPTLRTVLDQVRDAGHRYVALDLSRVTFLAAAGLDLFTETDRRLRADAGTLILTHPPERVRRLLRISGVDATLSVFPQVRAAADAVSAGSG